jgi:hypothetical protein
MQHGSYTPGRNANIRMWYHFLDWWNFGVKLEWYLYGWKTGICLPILPKTLPMIDAN